MKNRKKLLSLALSLLMVLSLLPATAVTAQALELGTPDDPIRISTASDLNLIRYGLDKHYILVNDIDLSGYSSWDPIGSPGANDRFSGTLDGNWHTISNLKINSEENYCIGLFGYISKPAAIKNLKLTNVNITASSDADVGGLVGVVRNDLGDGDNVLIENCYIDGVVSNSGAGKTGGLVGYLYQYSSTGATVSGCWSNVAVTGQNNVGGLVGSVYNSSVINSFATGTITGDSNTGGLVGSKSGVVEYSYATGKVNSLGGGGLIGSVSFGTVTNSYYDSATTSKEDTGKGDPKTTSEMKTPETFAGWDTDIWNLVEGQYPNLNSFDSTNPYTITYNIGEGSGEAPVEIPKAAFQSFLVADPSDLTPPEGLVFKEWNTESSGSGTSYFVGDFVGMPTNNLTLYAIWAKQYTFTYDANDGSNPPESKAYFEGDLFWVAQKTGMIEPDGKQFVKWNTQKDGAGTSYNPGNRLTMPAQNITLYAIWAPFQDGSEAAPYLVNDCMDLYGVMFDTDAHYKQADNIIFPDPEDFGEVSNWIPPEDFIPEAFTGSFDGDGFTISNLIINSEEPAVGLFGSVAGGALLKNINLVDAEVTSTCNDLEVACVGALVGHNAGAIQNCTVTGTVSGRAGASIGGLVGKNVGTMENCIDNAVITETSEPETEPLYFNASKGEFRLGDPEGEIITDLGGWSYNSDASTLTLNNFTWETLAPQALVIVRSEGEPLTIHLAQGSENSIISLFNGKDRYSCGLEVEGSLIIDGKGALTVQSGTSKRDYVDGIYVWGDLLIKDGIINATSGDAVGEDSEATGIYVEGDITVSGGTVTATASDAAGGYSRAAGIYAEGDITVNGGTVTATSGDAVGEDSEATGIYVGGDITVSGGTVVATGSTCALYTEEGDISITADKYNYWTNTEASAAGAVGPVNGSSVPFDNETDPPYKYVKIARIIDEVSKGGGSAASPPSTSISFTIPPAFLSGTGQGEQMTFDGNVCTLTVPADILSEISSVEGKRVEIVIGEGDKNNLPDDVKAKIGNRPLISINMLIDGKRVDWSNPDAPVTVSIPYTPTAEELRNPESIVIWYIDGSGNVVTIPNGHYDAVSKTVIFSTTHFSDYAVVYKPGNFRDVDGGAWYSKAVNYLAARGITNGTGDNNFSPDAKLTRGEFIVMLMNAYGITPDVSPVNNFSDAGNTYYTGYLSAAKRLGLSSGVGDNRYAPEAEITRQEMFTLLYNILKSVNQLPQGGSSKTISNFSDADQIKSWAKEAVSLLVKTEIVEGNTGKLNPTGTTTRAEMAQVLYKLGFPQL